MFRKLSRWFLMSTLIMSLLFSQGRAASAQPLYEESAQPSTLIYLPLVSSGNQTVEQTEAFPVANEVNSVVAATGTPTKSLPSTLYFSLEAPVANLPGIAGQVEANDIIRCAFKNNTCTWSMYLKGNDIGLSGVNLRDFEVLTNGDIIFTIDPKKTLTVDGVSTQVNARDVLRYQASDGTLHSVLVGASIGLTKSSEDIDSVAWTSDGHMVIGTRGTAKFSSGMEARDRDLVAIVGGAPSLYFVGDPVGLHSSDKDINAAAIANPSEDLYIVTKGSYTVDNGGTKLKGKKSDILGCTPLTHDPINSCFFFKVFTAEQAGLSGLIDGLSTCKDTDNIYCFISSIEDNP